MVSNITTYEFNKNYDEAGLDRLNDNLNKIEDINLQYPFIEDTAFIARWDKNKNSNSDSALRYTTYCEYVSYFVQDLAEYFKYDNKKIEDFIDVKQLIKPHKGWWGLPNDTFHVAPYPKTFNDLIKYYSQ
jgi:hypothetical protein